MTFDYFSYWNGDATAALFQMIAALTASGDFLALVKSMTLFGLLSCVAAAVIRIEGRLILSWFAATVLFFFIALFPKCNVLVTDVRALTARTIADVPLGIGVIAGTSSAVGKWLAETFETAMTDVDAEKFSQFGAVFPERVVAAIHKAGPILPKTRVLLNDFVSRCVAPEILDADAKRTELMQSSSLWDTVKQSGWVNPARFMLVDGEPLFCDAAVAKIEAVIQNEEIPAQEKLLMTRLSSADDGLTEAALRKAVPEARAVLLGTSESMEKSLEHAMLLSAVPEGMERVAERTGAPLAAGAALARAQGSLSAEISFRAMGELASAFLPKLRTALEFITLAVFPIVVVMAAAMVTAAGTVIRMYVTIFVWLMLWAPLAAVINYLLIHIDASPMTQLMEAYGGVTLESADLVRELGASSQAMAGCLMLLMPAAAFMIARASEMGAAGLASAVMAPAGSAAGAQSAAAAMGNLSAGNASLSNVSAGNTGINKTDLSSSFTSGDVAASTTPYGTVTRNAATGQVTGMTAASWNLGVTASTTSSSANASLHSTSSDQSAVIGQSAVRTTGAASTATQTASHLTSTGFATIASTGTTTSNAKTETFSQSTGYGFSEGSSFARSAQNRESLQGGFSGGIRAGSSNDRPSPGSPAASGTVLQIGSAADGAGSMDPSDSLMPMPKLIHSAVPNAGKSDASPVQPQMKTLSGQFDFGMQTQVMGAISDTAVENASSSKNKLITSALGDALTSLHSVSRATSDTNSNIQTSGDGFVFSELNSAQDAHLSSNFAAEHSSSVKMASRNGGFSITGDISQALGQKAMDEFSSPEAFLEHFSNPMARAALVRSINLNDDEKNPLVQNLASGPTNEHLSELPLEKIHDQNVRGVSSDAESKQAEFETRTPAHLDASSNFSAPRAGLSKPFDSAALTLGVARKTAEIFREGATSPARLADIGFAGASMYASPEEISRALRESADKDPDLRQSLIELGKRTAQ